MPLDRPETPPRPDEHDGRPSRPADRLRRWLGFRPGLVAWAVLLAVIALPGAAAAAPGLVVTEPSLMVVSLLGYAGIMYLFMRLITYA